MKKRSLVLSLFASAYLASSASMAYEFDDTHTIVVSDNWCAPWNDGTCYTCNDGRIITRAACQASWCDNMEFLCHDPPTEGGVQLYLYSTRFYTEWTSESGGELSTNAVCPAGSAMIGMKSVGDYSDSIQTICRPISVPSGMTMYRVEQPSYISNVGTTTAYALSFMMGASCQANVSHCANMFYWEAMFEY